MPPQSKKRKLISESHSGKKYSHVRLDTISDVPDARLLASASWNQKGFLGLPNELISLILSHFPIIRTEHILLNPTSINNYSSAPDFFARFNTLRALSQTCRYARRAYLPLLWERFQVCLATNPRGAWFRELGMALERRSKGMLESPHLWPYVRVVTVSLTRFQTSSVLPPFIQLLSALPNVHTLEIPHAHSAISVYLEEFVKGSVFSTIQKVIMPTCTHDILRCCPAVQEVICNEDDGGRLVDALAHGGCSRLEVIQGIAPGPVIMKRFIKANPPLKRIRVNLRLKEQDRVIRACSAFPSLRILELDCESGKNVEDLVKLAKDALSACADSKPPGKVKKARTCTNEVDAERPLSEPRQSYSDPKAVRVIYFPRRSGYYHNRSPSDYVPEQVVVSPI